MPFLFNMGLLYLAFAAAGGLFFLLKCRSLMRNPGRATARAAFLASLVQLCAVLIGAMLDAAIF